MTRVLVLTSTFPRWEKDTVPPFVYYLSAGLAERGHEMHVLAPHARGANAIEALGNIQVRRFRYGPERFESLCYEGGITNKLREKPSRWLLVPFFLVLELLATINLVRKFQIEVIHAHWILPQGLVSAVAGLVLRRPVIMTAHGSDVLTAKGWLRRMLLKLASRRATACTVNSKLLLNQLNLKTGVTAELIPMGVDTQKFHLPTQPKMPNDGSEGPYPRILFVGRLVEQKGVNYLILAVKEICNLFPKTTLTVVGEGPAMPELVRLTIQLGLASNVEFVGPVANEEIPALYEKSEVVVVPSIESSDGSTEALGIVLLEAAACGVPVVATRVGGIPDVIDDGVNGILTAPGDAPALARGILDLLRDQKRYARISAEARLRVETNYSWESVVADFDTLIKSSVKTKRQSPPRRLRLGRNECGPPDQEAVA